MISKMRLLASFLLFLLVSNAFSQESIFLQPSYYNLQNFDTIEKLFPPPAGFTRVNVQPNSFSEYLRNMPVLADSFNVRDFQDRIKVKSGDSTLAGVVPVNIKGRRLVQCMDIIVYLHADFLHKTGNLNSMEYPLPDGTLFSWNEWKTGYREVFERIRFVKKKVAAADSSERNRRIYLNRLFNYSDTQTFYHYYSEVEVSKILPADFIVKKGKRKHAVLIVDIAENALGEKVALIGQGDTPACQFYLLKDKKGNPWFEVSGASDCPDLPIRKKMFWTGLRRF